MVPKSGEKLSPPMTVLQGCMPEVSLVIPLQLFASLTLSHLLIDEVEQSNKEVTRRRKTFQFPMCAFLSKLSM